MCVKWFLIDGVILFRQWTVKALLGLFHVLLLKFSYRRVSVCSSGYQTVMPNQQQSYQNMMQPPQNQTHGSVGHQLQGMMVQYPSVPSYQVSAAFSRARCWWRSSSNLCVCVWCFVCQVSVPQQVYYSIAPPNQQNTGRYTLTHYSIQIIYLISWSIRIHSGLLETVSCACADRKQGSLGTVTLIGHAHDDL